MAQSEKHLFQGMNQDIDARLMTAGNYRSMLNCRVLTSDDNNTGAVTNSLGNTAITDVQQWDSNTMDYITSSLPTGTNTVIGAYENRDSGRVFYFIHNSNQNHGIYEYKLDGTVITKLFQSDVLNFDLTRLITAIGYAADVLYWCDGVNPIQQLDLDTVNDLTAPHTLEQISFIKIAPKLSPHFTKVYSTNVDNRQLLDHTYWFSYRYSFKDKSKSVLSPISAPAVTIWEQFAPQNDPRPSFIDVELTDDILHPPADTAKYAEIIEKIEVFYKKSETDSWAAFSVIDFGSATTVRFDNTKVEFLLDPEQAAKISEAIPFNAQALTISKNRVLLGNYEENYDLPEISGHFIEFTGINKDRNKTGLDDQSINQYNWGLVFFDQYRRNAGVIPFDEVKDDGSVSIPPAIGDSAREAVSIAPRFDLSTVDPLTIPEWAHSYSIHRTENLKKSTFTQAYVKGSDIKSENTGNIIVPLVGKASVKFFDPFVLTLEQSWVDQGILAGDIIGFPDRPDVEFAHVLEYPKFGDPLELLMDRAIGYRGNENVARVFPGGSGVIAPTTTKITIDVSKFVNDYGFGYNYQRGDRVYIPKLNADLPIIDITGNVFTLKWEQPGTAIDLTRSEYDTVLVEFYKPVSTPASNIYYEISADYLIDNPGTENRGFSTTSDLLINQSTAYQEYHDRYQFSIQLTNFSSSNKEVVMQSIFPNSSYPDLSYERIGRPLPTLIDSFRFRNTTGLRYSNPIVQNTNINGLSQFDGLNQEDLPIEVGPIQKLITASNAQAEGTVVLSVQTNDIISLYIGESMFKDTSGNATVVTTDKYISSYNILKRDVGTQHGESVVQEDGIVYGFDAQKGISWQYAQNGLQLISDRGMRNYHRKIGDEAKKATGSRVLGFIDEFHNEYILSFQNLDTASDQTLAYNREGNTYSTFYSYIPEYGISVNNTLLTWKDGSLYIHDTNTVRNNFYGVQGDSEIKFISNIHPSQIKVYEDISIEGSDPWNMGMLDEKSLRSLPGAQSTSLSLTDFEDYEGYFYSHILKNELTPNIVAPQLAILHGDYMRGDYMEITLTNSLTSKIILRTVNVGFYDSSGHQSDR